MWICNLKIRPTGYWRFVKDGVVILTLIQKYVYRAAVMQLQSCDNTQCSRCLVHVKSTSEEGDVDTEGSGQCCIQEMSELSSRTQIAPCKQLRGWTRVVHVEVYHSIYNTAQLSSASQSCFAMNPVLQ